MMSERRALAAWLAVLGAYFVGQALLRVAIGPSLELDEAEAFYHARRLALGYGPQPPLYFWLQWGLFQALGEGVVALAALKALLLWGTLAAVLLLLRPALGTAGAGAAALSLGLLPALLWESQRALTHSVLAVMMAALIALAAVRALRRGGWGDHALLGLAVGLGLLSKFNIATWPFALIVAAAVLPDWRGGLRPLRLGLAAAVAAAVVLPVGLWMQANPALAGASLHKLGAAATAGPIAARLLGTAAFFSALAAALALLLVALGPVAWAVRRRPAPPLAPEARLLGLAAAIAIGLLALGLLAGGFTEWRERWFMPVSWALPAVAAAWLWPRLGGGGRRRLIAGAGGLWLLAAVALPYASLRDPGFRGADFGPLAAALAEAGAGPDRPVWTRAQWVAGNLALQAPELAPRFLAEGGPAPAGPHLRLGETEEEPPPPGAQQAGVARGSTIERYWFVPVDEDSFGQ